MPKTLRKAAMRLAAFLIAFVAIAQAGRAYAPIERAYALLERVAPFDAGDPAGRLRFAREVLSELGGEALARKASLSDSLPDGVTGSVAFSRDVWTGRAIVSGVFLRETDERGRDDQIKTVFHETYHALMDGRPTDCEAPGVSYAAFAAVEDCFAELAAIHMAEEYGIARKFQPSKPGLVAAIVPRLRAVDAAFADCASLADFGEEALSRRLAGGGAHWQRVYDAVSGESFDVGGYFRKYAGRIKLNRAYLLDEYMAAAGIHAADRGGVELYVDSLFAKEPKDYAGFEITLRDVLLSQAMNVWGVEPVGPGEKGGGDGKAEEDQDSG